MDYFYCPQVRGTGFSIEGEEVTHLVHVMRKKEGDEIRIVDGLGTAYDARIESVSRTAAAGTILRTYERHNEPALALTLAVGLLKNPSKFDFLIESVQCLPQDAKVLIFCEYVETVESLRQVLASEGIRSVTLTGSDSTKKRMAAVDAFQVDPAVRVFIGTTPAAGVGITLTAANYVFFASLPWTPALKRQAEDRAYRSGQKRDVIVIVPVVAETIDEQIVALLDSKREIEVSLVEANRTRVCT